MTLHPTCVALRVSDLQTTKGIVIARIDETSSSITDPDGILIDLTTDP